MDPQTHGLGILKKRGMNQHVRRNNDKIPIN